VEVAAIGLNFADIFAVFGLYGATPSGSFVPGLEYSGTVRATGPGVHDLREGDKVMGVTRFGAYASIINIVRPYVMPLPEGWDFDQGAAFPVQAFTAYYALFELGNLQSGQTVLIQSAAGGVGVWANRIAKKAGAITIGCVGSASKLELLKKEGYDAGFVRSADFAGELKRVLEGRPLNLVLECIGGRVLMESYKALAPEGRLVVYGSAHYGQQGDRPNYLKLWWKYRKRPLLDPQRMIEQNKSVMGFNLIYLYEKAERIDVYFSRLASMNLGKPLIGHRYPFDRLKEALRMFQTGQTTGKVVVQVDPTGTGT
jgi:NADPH:quinone reductase-like Zn-dependent oxidoreductase